MRDPLPIASLVAGALAMGYAISALFFAKFWRRTRNRLFAWYAVAFTLLAVQRVLLVLFSAPSRTAVPWSYAIRLAAFLLILLAIGEANFRSRGPDVARRR